MTLPAGTRLGPYEILALLGAGGMGEVYRARDTRLDRDVAIKVLPQSVAGDAAALARFEREAKAVAALSHPNILAIHDVGTSGGITYAVMELLEGESLRQRLQEGPLPQRKALEIAREVALGLAAAHERGIVHRDLKPENLFVTSDGRVKILDFGLARQLSLPSADDTQSPTAAQATEPGTVFGTVGYMAPEQLRGHPADARSDIFSFGAVLYEMCSGRRPFRGDTAIETMNAILKEDPPELSESGHAVASSVERIVRHCLEKNPGERFQSARDLAFDLSSLSGLSTSGTSVTVDAVPGRRRLAVPALAAAALALLAAGALGGWLILRRASTAQAPSFHRLTFRSGNIGNARFAPDGQTIVYGASWLGESTRTMYSMRIESPESRPYDFKGADILAISSSGEMAFLLEQVGIGGVLARAPLSGGAAREVLAGVAYAGADWAPDGKELAVIHIVERRQERLEYPIGKVIVESADNPDAPRFSPRGDAIAFLSVEGDTVSLAIVDVSGKRKRILSRGWNAIAGTPCWRPDGKEIWITAADTIQAAALYAIDLNGKRRLITRVPGSLELDDISRDGRVLASHHTILDIVSGLAPGQVKERDLSWLDGSSPSDLSLDGKTLVLTESGEGSGGTPAVYLRKTDGSPAVRLGEGSAVALSPDGKWVLATVSAGAGKPERLVLLPTGPGETRVVNDRLEFFTGGAWLPDGKRFVFSAREKGHLNRIRVQSLEGGDAQPLSPEGVFLRPGTNPVTPDGKFVLGIGRGTLQPSLYPLEGGEPRPVAGMVGADDWAVQWTQDGRFLYVHQQSGVPNKVWLLDPASGKKTLFLEIKPGEPVEKVYTLLMTRDGKSYVYGTERVLSELYMIEGLR